MEIIVGVDIGNATTEVALAKKTDSKVEFLSSGLHSTTGLKGTIDNVKGIKIAVNLALKETRLNISDVSVIKINEATPVIGDVSMETITETIPEEQSQKHSRKQSQMQSRKQSCESIICIALLNKDKEVSAE